ncbi:MAG TPA: YkgJ family cysteine cluster protein [Polyangiaceae bacterium]|nr:YkgJ family cysteine cluster protein [Polyangiaceae bacterium]
MKTAGVKTAGGKTAKDLLRFRCTGCGNCCKEPLLPLTDTDLRSILDHTGDAVADVVRFVDRNGIDMDDEPEAFVILPQGKRVMVLRHQRGGCRYLDAQDRCGIYDARPLGCRIFPFDPRFERSGKLRRLKLIQATDCLYELDGANDPSALYELHQRYVEATRVYHEKVAEWNRLQRKLKRADKPLKRVRKFFEFLGVPVMPGRTSSPPSDYAAAPQTAVDAPTLKPARPG